jgi:hypothetical protein
VIGIGAPQLHEFAVQENVSPHAVHAEHWPEQLACEAQSTGWLQQVPPHGPLGQ